MVRTGSSIDIELVDHIFSRVLDHSVESDQDNAPKSTLPMNRTGRGFAGRATQ